MQNFDSLVSKLINIEGGYSNNIADKGSETKYGISKRSYPNLDIKNLTMEQAKDIYYREYWNICGLEKINNDDLTWSIFKAIVNKGIFPGIKILQMACNQYGANLEEDGYLGNKTLAFINSYDNQLALLDSYMVGLVISYLDICLKDRSQRMFLIGWLTRTLLD